MTVPPNFGRLPQPFGSELQGYFTVSIRNSSAQAQFDVSGPFLCTRVPMNGELQMPSGKANQMTVIDERVKFPIETGLVARSIVTDIETNVQYEVVFVQRFQDFLMAFLKRSAAD